MDKEMEQLELVIDKVNKTGMRSQAVRIYIFGQSTIGATVAQFISAFDSWWKDSLVCCQYANTETIDQQYPARKALRLIAMDGGIFYFSGL